MAIDWRNEPVIDSVQLPGSETKYWVQDTEAREKIETLANATHFIGVSTTEITDGGTEKPTINEEEVNPVAGDIVIWKPLTGAPLEFIWDGSKWNLLGGQALEGLGDLAFKDNASGSYIPEGNVILSSNTTEVISSVSRGTLGVVLTLSDVAAEDFSVVTLSGSAAHSFRYPTVVTDLTSRTLSMYVYDIAFSASETHDVITNISTNEVSVVDDLTNGILPTISNQSTLTAVMGTGSSSTTLIFNLSDIGFSAGKFSDITTTTISEVSNVEGKLLSVTRTLDNDYTIYTSYSTQDLSIPYDIAFTTSLYYKTDITGQLETSAVNVATGLSATFSGTTSTITVS